VNEADAIAIPQSYRAKVEPDSTVLHRVCVGQVKHREIGDLRPLSFFQEF
jgi:hypothetical protein